MFGIGGFNPISLLATTALGPLGGIVSQLASQIISQIGQQFIQNLGSQLGLPQSAIDLAQGSFAGSYGDFGGQLSNLNESITSLGQELGQGGFPGLDGSIAALGQHFGASPSDIGDSQRAVQDLLRDAVNNNLESDDAKEAKAGGRAGGWLRAMAEALGKKLDAAAHEMQDLANKIDKEDPSTTTDFQVSSQEFNMLMNAANTAIKTIGEAMGNTARKQ